MAIMGPSGSGYSHHPSFSGDDSINTYVTEKRHSSMCWPAEEGPEHWKSAVTYA